MWWIYIVIAAVLVFGVYGFVTLTRNQTNLFSSKSYRRAEDLYPDYADPAVDDPERKGKVRKRPEPPDRQR
jgi:hypothetical protein